MVELRADLLEGEHRVSELVSACPLPVLYTLRSQAEGGRGPDDPTARAEALVGAWESGAMLLDLEANRDLHLLEELGIDGDRVVLSWHDHDGCPEDLQEIVDRLLESRAGLVKAVPTLGSLADLESTLEVLIRANAKQRRAAVFGMGLAGQASRYLAPCYGPAIAYCPWDELSPVAPGQVDGRRLEAAIGHLDAVPKTLFAVVGRNVSRSLSPVLHGAGHRADHRPACMVPLSVADDAELEELFVGAGSGMFGRLGIEIGGYAVTTPFKDVAAEVAKLESPRARRAGAANTLVIQGASIFADTTDADGVVASLIAAGIEPEGEVAIVQGSGGAARAAAVGLDLAGASVFLRGRDGGSSQAIAEAMDLPWLEPGCSPSSGATMLVNATPLGSRVDDPLPFSNPEIEDAETILDMVYSDHLPALAKAADAAGTLYLDGLEMLLNQGVAQFSAFTRSVPPRQKMSEALREFAAGPEPS